MKTICSVFIAVVLALGCLAAQASAESLAAPELESPKNEAKNQVPTTLLKWKAVPGAKSYRVLLAVSAETLDKAAPQAPCADCLVDMKADASPFQVPDKLLNKKNPYFWTVRAVNDAGEGPNAPARSYTLAPVYFFDMD
jgi:hypothetical protein